MAWKIFYSDGSTFSHTQGTPEEAPAFGIVCIVQSEPTLKRVIPHGFDWYYWVDSEQQWWGGDISGVIDRMLHRLPLRALLQGRSVDHKTFWELMRLADEDPEFRAYLKG